MIMKNVLIIWLWEQWEKYVNYFLKNNYNVFWVCKTLKTKDKIQSIYWILVDLDYNKILNNYVINIVVIALPPKIQWQVALEIAYLCKDAKILIELPITWDYEILLKLSENNNVYFFLEEYFTKISYFLRQIDYRKVDSFFINLYIDINDKSNYDAFKISYIHLLNNFLIDDFDFSKLNINLKYHNSKNIYYSINFTYNNNFIEYNFFSKKTILLNKKDYNDNYNFDYVISKIFDIKIDKKYYLNLYKYVWKICQR